MVMPASTLCQSGQLGAQRCSAVRAHRVAGAYQRGQRKARHVLLGGYVHRRVTIGERERAVLAQRAAVAHLQEIGVGHAGFAALQFAVQPAKRRKRRVDRPDGRAVGQRCGREQRAQQGQYQNDGEIALHMR